MWLFWDPSIACELCYSWDHQIFCHNALYQNSCPGGWGILAHILKTPKIAIQILDISSCQCHVFGFLAFLLHWHYNPH